MRNIIKTIAATLALIILGTVTVCAADSYVTLYGFSFDINDSGEAVIHGYDNRSADVKIPNKLLGSNVAVIDDYVGQRKRPRSPPSCGTWGMLTPD